MPRYAIISRGDKRVYVNQSKNPGDVLRVYVNRLKRGKMGMGRLWWLQESWDKYGSESFDYETSAGLAMDSLGLSSEGYEVYVDGKGMPVRDFKCRPNMYIPGEYRVSIGKLLELLKSGVLDVRHFNIYLNGIE